MQYSSDLCFEKVLPNGFIPALTVSVQVLHGDMNSVKKENPMLFSKGIAQVQKMGLFDVITPGRLLELSCDAVQVPKHLFCLSNSEVLVNSVPLWTYL